MAYLYSRTMGLARRMILAWIALAGFLTFTGPALADAADPEDLPLFAIDDMVYTGAFRIPADTYGESSINYSQGPLAYDAGNHSIFIVGHAHHQAIAEFSVPEIVLSYDVASLNMATAPDQSFSQVLDRASGGNPQNLNRIGGLILVSGANGPELLVNAYEYYDAPGDNTQTSLVVRDPSDLAGSAVDGMFTLDGGAGHTSGWLSPIPDEWQDLLGGTHITGQSSGIPIISRTSVGPSAFAFDPLDMVGADDVPDPVPTVTLLDFSLNDPLSDDLSNSTLTNDIWTHLSRAVYGFIVPNTRTYVTLGHSGGHYSGVCYKCTQDDGTTCGGYCAPDPEDYYHYYWLWDVSDLLAVKEGRMAAHEVRPYDYGVFPTPFDADYLGGGSFDPASGLLYITVQKGDSLQGTYARPPLVVVYDLFGSDPELSDMAEDFGRDDCDGCGTDLDGDGDVDGEDLAAFALE